MWDAIGNMFIKGNGTAICILIIFVVIATYIAVRFGHVKIKSDKFTIVGETRGNERLVMQKQLSWLYDAVFAFEQKIPTSEGYNEFRGRYILSILYIDLTDWVLNNHIEETQRYIKLKQSEVWNKVQTMVEKDELKTTRFKNVVDEYVRYIIHNLVMIRKEYEK